MEHIARHSMGALLVTLVLLFALLAVATASSLFGCQSGAALTTERRADRSAGDVAGGESCQCYIGLVWPSNSRKALWV